MHTVVQNPGWCSLKENNWKLDGRNDSKLVNSPDANGEFVG